MRQLGFHASAFFIVKKKIFISNSGQANMVQRWRSARPLNSHVGAQQKVRVESGGTVNWRSWQWPGFIAWQSDVLTSSLINWSLFCHSEVVSDCKRPPAFLHVKPLSGIQSESERSRRAAEHKELRPADVFSETRCPQDTYTLKVKGFWTSGFLYVILKGCGTERA